MILSQDSSSRIKRTALQALVAIAILALSDYVVSLSQGEWPDITAPLPAAMGAGLTVIISALQNIRESRKA